MHDIQKELGETGSSRKVKKRRKRRKTEFKDGKVTLKDTCGRKRRRETFEAAKEIHGGTKRAASVGLIDTVLNRCSKEIITEMMMKSPKCSKVAVKKYKSELNKYESSNENMCRSVAVYYSGGVTGKRKYRKLYRDSGYKVNNQKTQTTRITIADCPVPRLVSYNKLMPFIKSIPIGTLYSVEELCHGMDDKVSGCYRSLCETLIYLAKFYFNKTSGYDLTWFDDTNTFNVALGGDGAPFGKDDTACAWLASFLNIGRGVLSSNENFLIFGANCSENALPVLRYISFLLSEIKTLQKETYTIFNGTRNVTVKFKISELPNDMKMLAFLAGELTNSAKYFSSFADVSTTNGTSLNGTFGREEKHLWKPWDYTHRLKVVKKVEEEKKGLLRKKLTQKTKRKKITELISGLKSRQEFKPLVENVIDVAHVEPLHLKNNACALVHKYFLEEVVKVSNIPSDHISFSQLSSNCPLVCYVNVLKSKCSLSRLAKKVMKHYDETGVDVAKKFEYRFTGKDSRLFLHNFMFLIDAIEPGVQDNTKSKFHFHVLAFLALNLRNCVSLFNRLDISDEQVSELEHFCSVVFKLNISHFNFNQTMWTLGHVVPVHTREMKGKYGMGLGLNSMEGRESKHVSIGKYSVNTIFNSRWEQIFMHEYVSLIWLRKQGYNITKPVSSSGLAYIPKRAIDNDLFCGCGLDKAPSSLLCKYCSHPFRAQIKSIISR